MLRPLFLLLSTVSAGAVALACTADANDAVTGEEQDVKAHHPSSSSSSGGASGSTALPPASTPEMMGRRVCSWNMRRLGNKFGGVDKDYASAAKVIDTKCDLIAVEEDMSTTHDTNKGYDAMVAALGSAWGGLVTAEPAPFPATSNSEHYAFFYRKSAASVCDGWTNAKRFPDPQDIFLREPAWGCFKVEKSSRPLLIAGYHAIFGEPAERRREVGFLDDDLDNNGTKDDFFNAMKASGPAGADLVLAGDFNLTTGEIKEVLPNYVDLTDGNGSTLNDQDGISSNEYDHFIVMPGEGLLTNTKPALVLDVREIHAPDAGFYETVSDHLPIRFILE